MGGNKKEARSECARNALHACIINKIEPMYDKLARRATGIQPPNSLPHLSNEFLLSLIKDESTECVEVRPRIRNYWKNF